jgi:hypothetical protein
MALELNEHPPSDARCEECANDISRHGVISIGHGLREPSTSYELPGACCGATINGRPGRCFLPIGKRGTQCSA